MSILNCVCLLLAFVAAHAFRMSTQDSDQFELPGSLQCHDEDDLQKYLAAKPQLDRMYTCSYDYHETNRFLAHKYVSMGQDSVNCYDLPAFSNFTEHHWHASGCTPFRRVTQSVAHVYNCVQQAAAKNNWLPEVDEVMQRASKYFWQDTTSDAKGKLLIYMRRKVNELWRDFGNPSDMSEEKWAEHAKDAAEAVLQCFTEQGPIDRMQQSLTPLQRSMRCLPSLWGRVGFGVGGVRNEGLVYSMHNGHHEVEMARFNCQKPEGQPCKETCHSGSTLKPLVCPRLAIAPLTHFNPKTYDQNMPMFRWLWHKVSAAAALAWCTEPNPNSGANCQLFTQCAEIGLSSSLCGSVPECCGITIDDVLPAEEQEVVTFSGENRSTAAWAVGAKALATRQGLFKEFS